MPDHERTIADRNVARALEVIDQVATQAADPEERRILSAAGDLLRSVGRELEPEAVLAEELSRALSH